MNMRTLIQRQRWLETELQHERNRNQGLREALAAAEAELRDCGPRAAKLAAWQAAVKAATPVCPGCSFQWGKHALGCGVGKAER